MRDFQGPGTEASAWPHQHSSDHQNDHLSPFQLHGPWTQRRYACQDLLTMWKLRYSDVEPAAAVVCAVLTQRLSTRTSELPAELVCWLLVPILVWATGRRRAGEEKQHQALPGNQAGENKPSRRSIWALAISITASSYFKNEGGVVKLCVSDDFFLLLSSRY